MRRFFLASITLVAGISYVGMYHATDATPAAREQAVPTNTPTTANANRLLQGQPGFFVPNLGQWDHAARFVHRSGPMTLFIQDRGWIIDLMERPTKPQPRPGVPMLSDAHQAMPRDGKGDQKLRGVALRMTFEGDAHVPDIVGERKLPGHHNYFLGNDETRWRTDVPLYSSVRYEDLYPGIDLRLREANGVPEYDLLLQPGADLVAVTVHVEGAQGLSIASDGSLVIETALGPVTQSVPETWQVGSDGRKREVLCNFALLGADRFGFLAPGWDGDTSLTIDPGLIWSTFLGGSRADYASALSVDASGDVIVAGTTTSTNFPTTSGAYDTSQNGFDDAFVTRLSMGVALYGDVHEIAIKAGGTQTLTVNSGKAHANKLYWIFGSITGTKPGVNLLGTHIPLNPDLYTNVAMGAVNTTVFTKFRGTLDANGLATASFVVPANLPLPTGFTFHHAYVVYDASGKFYMASNAVPLRMR